MKTSGNTRKGLGDINFKMNNNNNSIINITTVIITIIIIRYYSGLGRIAKRCCCCYYYYTILFIRTLFYYPVLNTLHFKPSPLSIADTFRLIWLVSNRSLIFIRQYHQSLAAKPRLQKQCNIMTVLPGSLKRNVCRLDGLIRPVKLYQILLDKTPNNDKHLTKF